MSGKPFVMEWAEADSEEGLKRRYLSEAHPRRRRWLHGLWLVRRGWRVDEVADAVGASRRTVERWSDWYRPEGGVAGVLAHRHGGTGQPPWLTVELHEQVADAIATGRFRTAAEIRAGSAAPFGVAYRPGGVTSLVGRRRCHPKLPRPLHEQADPAAQAAWSGAGRLDKGGLQTALAAAGLTQAQVIGWADEIPVGLLGQVRRRWGRCGVRLHHRPAERLFAAIRAEVEGEVDADLDAKCARVAAILTGWDAQPERVRSLVGWHWILDALEQLPDPTTS